MRQNECKARTIKNTSGNLVSIITENITALHIRNAISTNVIRWQWAKITRDIMTEHLTKSLFTIRLCYLSTSIKALQEDEKTAQQKTQKYYCTGRNLANLNEEAIKATKNLPIPKWI